MNRKIAALWLGLVMLLSFVVTIVEIAPVIESSTIIYVDDVPGEGSGNPAENYTSIQAAIDNASDGETIFVHNGTYYESVRVNKTINLIGMSRDNTTIIGNGIGDVMKITMDRVNVSGFTVVNGNCGIILGPSLNSNITGNNVSNNEYGIYLAGSSDNIITSNIVSSNNKDGIVLDIIFSIPDPPIPSNSNIVTNNDVSNNRHGITVWSSSNGNTIAGNNVTSNTMMGVYVSFSSNNNIIGNNISNNEYSINLTSSSDNRIYHNNFISNTYQANDDQDDNYWDDGYPSGGNYWSDYSGIDLFKGPNQDIPGSDGIGDIPYIIDADSQDTYPLMQPYKPIENYIILKQGWNLISIPLIQDNQSLTKVLEMIDRYYDAVQWYDNKDGHNPWKHYKVGKPFGNDLNHLNETKGFWIHINQSGDTIFLYNGTQPTSNQTIPLHPGWNMVGYPSLSNKTRDVALNNLTFYVEVDAIWTFDASTQKWEEIGPTDSFELGRGYWIHAIKECVWEVPL